MSCNRTVLIAFLSTVALLGWPTASHADDAACQTSEGFLDKNLLTSPQGETGEVMQGAHITGTVTAFGSVCVNGLRVSYDETSRIRSVTGQSLAPSAIKVGQVVDIRAEAHDNGANVHATRITVAPNAYGSISKINYQTGMILIGGDAVLVSDRTALKKLHTGNIVSVSGLPNEKNMIVASLIVKEASTGALSPKTLSDLPDAKLKVGTYVSFEGYIEKVGPDQNVTIDGRTYPVTTLECGDGPLKAGERVISMGRIQEDGTPLISGFAKTAAPDTKLEK